MTTNLPYVQFSKNSLVQDNFIVHAVNRVMPPIMVRAVVAMIIYDLQFTKTPGEDGPK